MIEELLALSKPTFKKNLYQNNVCGLNEGLAEKQGLTQDEFDELTHLYHQMKLLINLLDVESTEEETQKLVQELRDVEGKIQQQWKFPLNDTFHYFTFLTKRCICPKMDNMDRRGTSYKIYTLGCPIHLIKTEE